MEAYRSFEQDYLELGNLDLNEVLDPLIFPHHTENWENLNSGEYGTFKGVELLQGWLVTDTVVEEKRGKKEKTYTWTDRLF
jgi:hypothetical protein